MRADAAALVRLADNPNIARMLTRMPQPYTRADAIGFVEILAQREDERPYAMVAPDDGLVKAGGSRSPHRLYNIGNSRSEDLMRMISLIEAACGRKAEMEFLPLQPGDVPETFADIGAIQADLGFAPTTPIDVGVPAFVEWYRAYHSGRNAAT